MKATRQVVNVYDAGGIHVGEEGRFKVVALVREGLAVTGYGATKEDACYSAAKEALNLLLDAAEAMRQLENP